MDVLRAVLVTLKKAARYCHCSAANQQQILYQAGLEWRCQQQKLSMFQPVKDLRVVHALVPLRTWLGRCTSLGKGRKAPADSCEGLEGFVEKKKAPTTTYNCRRFSEAES
ncbi:MAG: hypothetical protein WBN40_08565 [Pseudomonadales bacterium]